MPPISGAETAEKVIRLRARVMVFQEELRLLKSYGKTTSKVLMSATYTIGTMTAFVVTFKICTDGLALNFVYPRSMLYTVDVVSWD